LLTVKPQLGLLVPVGLLAAGLWRVAASAIVTALIGIVASGLAFGLATWPAWVHQMHDYANGFDAVFDLMPTIYGNLREISFAPLPAAIEQAAFSAGVGFVVWRAFRHGFWRRRMRSTTTCR
jgi:hypothetical protein